MDEQYTVKQHIVPQAYLNRFAEQCGNSYMIGTRIESGNKVILFKQSVKKVGYINEYYEVSSIREKNYWEHYFRDTIEPLYGNRLTSIISVILMSMPNKRVLNDKAKEDLSTIIVSQMLRVPDFIDEKENCAPKFIESYKAKFLEANPSLDRVKRALVENITFSKDQLKDMILSGIFSAEKQSKYCSILKDKIWAVYVNVIAKTMPFVTSDNPVVLCNLQNGTIGHSNGIACDDTEIIFPLCPNILIVLYSKNSFIKLADNLDCVRTNVNDERFIINVNRHLINQCFRHSFIPEPLFTAICSIEEDKD